MNTYSLKIACPNCGATAGFTEKSPNTYSCGYCNSVFEHTSILPDKNQEQVYYEYYKKLCADFDALDPQDPERISKIYAILVQMSGCVEGLANSKFYSEVLQGFNAYTSKELAYLANLGVSTSSTLEEMVEKDLVVETKFAADFNLLLAQSLFTNSNLEKDLDRALVLASTAQELNTTIFRNYDHNCVTLKLEILAKLDRKEALQEALGHLLEIDDTLLVKKLRYRFKEFL